MTNIQLEHPEWNKLFQQTFFRGVRNKTLQKLILLWINYHGNVTSPYHIKCEEIMELLKCSRRTAYDYRRTLGVIWY